MIKHISHIRLFMTHPTTIFQNDFSNNANVWGSCSGYNINNLCQPYFLSRDLKKFQAVATKTRTVVCLQSIQNTMI